MHKYKMQDSLYELQKHSLQEFSFSSDGERFLRLIRQRVDRGLDGGTVLLDGIQETDDFTVCAVSEHLHVLGEHFHESHQAALGLVPGVCA